jgi:hypothetical protein
MLDFVIDTCLEQTNKQRKLKPVVYYLQKIILVELNYNIYNKKLLAIIKAFRQ